MGFPRIEHIDQVLPAVDGRDEFQVREREGYISIDYNYVLPDSFDCPLRLECRGIKFAPDGTLLARPFHKFFNLGEKPETQPGALDLSRPHVVTEKLDGSMVHPTPYGTGLAFMTRAGITDIGDAASMLAQENDALWEFCWHCIEEGRTPIFEYTAPDNRIVIAYEEPHLTLLAVRDNYTGEYLDLSCYEGGPVPLAPFMGTIGPNMGWLVKEVRSWRTAEGIVIRFADGLHVKLKADDYVLRHRAKAEIGLEKNALRVVLATGVDDMLPLLPNAEASALNSYNLAWRMALIGLVDEVRRMADLASSMGRKAFACEVAMTLPALVRCGVYASMDDKEPYAFVTGQILKAAGSGPRLAALLEEHHLPRWADYWQGREEEPS